MSMVGKDLEDWRKRAREKEAAKASKRPATGTGSPSATSIPQPMTLATVQELGESAGNKVVVASRKRAASPGKKESEARKNVKQAEPDKPAQSAQLAEPDELVDDEADQVYVEDEDGHFLIPDADFLKQVGDALKKLTTDKEWLKANGVTTKWGGGGAAKRYTTNEEQTPKPKSYKALRIKQACRWISTTAFVSLLGTGLDPKDVVEVQATVYPPDVSRTPQLYISANAPGAIKRLATLFGGKTAGQALAEMAGGSAAILEAREKAKKPPLGLGIRPTTHPGQLGALISGIAGKKDDPDAGQYAILAAALKQPVVVAKGPTKGELGEPDPGVHAERRLQHEIFGANTPPGGGLDWANVGGLKRPCVVCYLMLYAPPGVDKKAHGMHPGRLWLSKAASAGLLKLGPQKAQDLAETIAKEIKTIYISPKDQTLASVHSTDTDSEKEDEEPSGAASAAASAASQSKTTVAKAVAKK